MDWLEQQYRKQQTRRAGQLTRWQQQTHRARPDDDTPLDDELAAALDAWRAGVRDGPDQVSRIVPGDPVGDQS